MIRALDKIYCEDKTCPLFESCAMMPSESLRLDEDMRAIDVLFVIEQPSADDVDSGRLGLDQAGKILRRCMGAALPEQVTWALTSVVRGCALDTSNRPRRPTADEIDRCRFFLDRDIKRLDPKVLVPLGQTATRLLTRTRQNILATRGTWRRVELQGVERIVLPAQDPQALISKQAGIDKNALPVFLNDLTMAG